MECVAEMQFDDDLFAVNLRSKPSQSRFVSVCGSAKSELEPKLLCECFFEAKGGSPVIKLTASLLDDAVGFGDFLLGKCLHPN